MLCMYSLVVILAIIMRTVRVGWPIGAMHNIPSRPEREVARLKSWSSNKSKNDHKYIILSLVQPQSFLFNRFPVLHWFESHNRNKSRRNTQWSPYQNLPHWKISFAWMTYLCNVQALRGKGQERRWCRRCRRAYSMLRLVQRLALILTTPRTTTFVEGLSVSRSPQKSSGFGPWGFLRRRRVLRIWQPSWLPYNHLSSRPGRQMAILVVVPLSLPIMAPLESFCRHYKGGF